MPVTCNVVKDLLPLYIEHLASTDSKQLIEEHMVACDDCRNALKDLTDDLVTTNHPPEPGKKLEGQVVSRIQRHMLLSKVAFLAIGALFGLYTTSRWQLQAPFIIFPLIGVIGEIMVGRLWVAPLIVFVANIIGALVLGEAYAGVTVLSGIFAFLTLIGSLIAFCTKRVIE